MESKNGLNDIQKEGVALTTLRLMLEQYCDTQDISFPDALLEFASCEAYDALFDFDTGIWREGPTYLRGWFDDMKKLKASEPQDT